MGAGARARARKNGQRQQVGKGEVGAEQAGRGPTSDQEWHFTVYTSGEGRKEARELLTYQAPDMLCRLGESQYNYSPSITITAFLMLLTT